MTAIESKKITVEELNIPINREFVLNNVILCVEPRNFEHTDYITVNNLDLSTYFRVIINDETSFRVTKQLLLKLGISPIELHELAKENARAEMVIENLGEFLFGVPDPNSPTVITSESKMFGAGIISDTEIYAELCRKNGVGHCYILPSSIHEILVMFADVDKEVLDGMVREINESEVAPDERLADHCYVYNAITNTINY